MYKVIPTGVKRLEDGVEIPLREGNVDFEEYKEWLNEGNEPEVADPIDFAAPLWDQFRTRRDLYLSRLADIAGRFSRRGDTAVPEAADAIAEGLLALPANPTLLACQTADCLQKGFVTAANNLIKAQLTNPATAPAIKAALDKVFK